VAGLIWTLDLQVALQCRCSVVGHKRAPIRITMHCSDARAELPARQAARRERRGLADARRRSAPLVLQRPLPGDVVLTTSSRVDRP
jgi:hypothetical protein